MSIKELRLGICEDGDLSFSEIVSLRKMMYFGSLH